MLATKLNAPISWTGNDPEITGFLDRLQGNIVKGHGRNNVVFMFCRFRTDAKAGAQAFLRRQAARVRSARHQLLATAHKRRTGEKDKAPLVCLFLSKAGYDYLGVPLARQPADPAFQRGMGRARLGDPAPALWDSHLRDAHLMVLVAVAGPDQAQAEATDLLNQVSTIGDVAGGHSGELIGNQFFNDAGHGVENFGYVDGRSQPLVLLEDLAGEGGTDVWPGREFPVSQFVVRDPGTADASAYGSYFVFRQLEQDVKGFRTREEEIVAGHENTFANRDSAGVGRLESGTPFELFKEDGAAGPDLTNNFVFASEPPRCPHFAHIRKVNPRTNETRGAIMIRRGITYGTRADAKARPGDASMLVLDDAAEVGSLPDGGVGLLFQSYQADISAQFERTQLWANSSSAGGIDPVIGQAATAPLDWPVAYGGAATERVDFFERQGRKGGGPYVRMLGGGYFFAPSLPVLHGL